MYKSLYQILFQSKVSLGDRCALSVKHKNWVKEHFHICGIYETPNSAIIAFGWKIVDDQYSAPFIEMVSVKEEWTKI